MLTRVLSTFSTLVFCALGGCGGSSSPTVTTPVTSVPPQPVTTDAWDAVKTAVDESPISDLRLIIGDSSGVIFEYEKGDTPANEVYRVASASKLLTGLTLMRLVEAEALSLSDSPQSLLPDWTAETTDLRSRVTLEQALSFTTGFNGTPLSSGCILRSLIRLENCVIEIHDDGIETIPGDAFYYGPEHMHIAAGMAQRAVGEDYVDIFIAEIAEPLNLENTRFETPSQLNPPAAGGAVSTANDYAKILQALMAGDIIRDLDVFLEDRTATVRFGFRPESIGRDAGDWHYGLGFWLECDSFVWDQACEENLIISSPGAFGWLPWIDFSNGYYGLIATEDSEGGLIAVGDRPTSQSVQLEQRLQPLILEALAE